MAVFLLILSVLSQKFSEATSQHQIVKTEEVFMLGNLLRQHIFKSITGAAFDDA